ncbi:E3 ubiquitin protein ligase RFWD3-like protein, partial [Tanacetum coccineum]
CLPCGHIFGLSCINKWIQLRKMQAKCPQCNVKIGPSGVTKLYASPVVLVEEEDQQKKDEVSKAKDLKKERNTDESLTAELVNETQKVFNYDAKVDTRRSRCCNFVLKHEMPVESARLFDMDAGYKTLLLARRVPGMGGRHKQVSTVTVNLEAPQRNTDESLTAELVNETQNVKVILGSDTLLLARRVPGMGGRHINMMNPQRKEEIMLPVSTKAVKDLHLSPCGRLALLASLEKKLLIISMGGNSVVLTYDLPMPAWSCLWDDNSPNYMYAGLQNGMLLVFDMRHTIRPVESIHGLDSRPIHTIQSFEHNTSHPQNTTQLLTASSCGPCLWNINGGLQRSMKVPIAK